MVMTGWAEDTGKYAGRMSSIIIQDCSREMSHIEERLKGYLMLVYYTTNHRPKNGEKIKDNVHSVHRNEVSGKGLV